MFSKMRKRPGAPASLAARLSLWYAGSAFVVLIASTGFLYWALVSSVAREHNQYLGEKINVFRLLLGKPGTDAILEWESSGESPTRPWDRVYSRVLAPDSRILVETRHMEREVPQRLFPARLETGRVVESNGRMYRILADVVNAPGGPYRVQVAIDLAHENLLLDDYRIRFALVLAAGLLATVLIAYRIGRHGVRPVEAIAESMRSIRSTTLDTRVDPKGYPSELRSLAQTFNELLDRLEDAFARLSRFSSDIAHELRTPVSNLRGEVEVALAKTRTAEEYREVLVSSLEECQRLTRLIDSLLFLARAESPRTEIRRETLDIKRELESIEEFYEAAAHEAGITLSAEVPAGITAALDRTLIQRAVANLVENAMAHTPPGGSIRLDASMDSRDLRIRVADTGAGIPQEHMPRVFDRFYRVDPARSKKSGGLGLGLAIVKTVAALHGGRVEVESEVGRGTAVSLALPVEPDKQMTKS